jgi:hypothetical protein
LTGCHIIQAAAATNDALALAHLERLVAKPSAKPEPAKISVKKT